MSESLGLYLVSFQSRITASDCIRIFPVISNLSRSESSIRNFVNSTFTMPVGSEASWLKISAFWDPFSLSC